MSNTNDAPPNHPTPSPTDSAAEQDTTAETPEAGHPPTESDGPSRSISTSHPFGRLNPDPGPHYRDTFTEEVKQWIIAAVQRAYDVVQERHDESLGYNAQTFGHNVYHIGRRQLEECCKRSSGQLTLVEELKALFRFQGGGYTIAFYKVGNSAEANIWESFPTSENGGRSVDGEGYPILIGLEEALLDPVESLRYAVVAHLGNATHGLCALYLCLPVQTQIGKIVRWGYAEPIYVADRAVGVSGRSPAAPPAEETIAPVDAPPVEPEGDVVVTAKESS